MKKLFDYFQSQHFSEKESQRIADSFSKKTFKKGDFFVEEGKTCRYLGFVESGFLQYFILVDGEEKTTYATNSNNFVTSLVSYLKEIPARENIRAVTDTVVWLIEKKQLQTLQKEIVGFNDFYIGILEWQICCIDESRLDAIMLSAQERYEKMLAKEPILIREIPLQYLASILGVTPRHLSRIRGKIR
jgi:signal-transduction protein with cAMP-binding, CBS, and nucleotidyltransferase domain